jgi:hypothetical protein
MLREMALMIQIAFQPAYDAFHAMFRFFQIKSLWNGNREIELDRYRIIDYYLCFPDKLVDFRFQREHARYKKVSKEFYAEHSFEYSPSGRVVLERMKPIQFAALETLAEEGFLEENSLYAFRVLLTDVMPSEHVSDRLSKRRSEHVELYDALSALLNDYDLLGPSGLKARADLLEYRYDAI